MEDSILKFDDKVCVLEKPYFASFYHCLDFKSLLINCLDTFYYAFTNNCPFCENEPKMSEYATKMSEHATKMSRNCRLVRCP